MAEEEKANIPASSDDTSQPDTPDNSAETTDKQMNNGNKSKEDEDDVPGDFFDDFLKDDFMAGLDIVDEESEESLKKKQEPKVIKIGRRLSSSVKKVFPKIDHVKKFRESPPDKTKVKPRSEEIKQEIRHLDAQLEKIRHKKPEKKPVKTRLGEIEPDELEAGHRRDPEKVRRDIQMDKQRCERRLITDIVETGLVPPGMELEVEYTTVHRQVRVDKHPKPGDLREILRSRRSRSHDKKPSKKSHTPDRKKRSLTPKERKKSPTPEKIKEKSEKDKKIHTPEQKQHSVKKGDEKGEKDSPKKSPKSDKSPAHSKPVKSPSHKLSKSPRKTPPKRRRSHSPLISEVESLKSSVDEIIESHLESRRAKREKVPSPVYELSRRRSPGRRSPPPRRFPPRRPSPRRARSPMLRRCNSPSPRRSPSRRHRSPRRSRSRSPSYRRRRRDSRSPRRSRHSRSRSRPKEKKSFLEELAEKLGHTQAPLHPSQLQPPYGHPMGGPYGPPGMPMPQNGPPMVPQNMQMGMMPMMQPGPMGMMNTGPGILGPTPNVPNPVVPHHQAPVPERPFFRPQGPPALPQQPSTSTYDPYDQSFFIGNDPLPPKSFNSGPSQSLGSSMEIKDSQRSSMSLEKIPADLSKLFEDDKIKLSEFLAITAKPQGDSSSSAKLQEKIKVISQCQEAIKILQSNRRYVGPLVLEKTNEQPQTSKQKYLSPLLKNPIVTLPFTAGTRKNNVSTTNEYPKFCQGLLYKVGICKQLPALTKKEVEKESPKMPVRVESPDVQYVPVKRAQAPPLHIQFSQVPSRLRTLHQVTQTDPQLSACKACERRKEIDLINTGTQVGDSKMSFSVSTQVCESDFYSTIPKSQSLAQLTPAQLMGRQLRNLDAPSRGNDYSSRGALYDDFGASRSNYRGNYNANDDIFPANPPPPSLFNRSPSPTNTLFGGTRASLSDTLRASLGSRYNPPRKY